MKKENYRFPAYEPGIPCTTVGVHYNTHDEEGFSVAALQYYGDDLHPGITDAIEKGRFLFVDAGIKEHEGKDWQQWQKEGVIFVGTMASPYDEHHLPEEIKETECSATLVARALELNGPMFVNTLRELVRSDRESENNILSFSSHLRNYGTLLNSYDQAAQTKLLRYAMHPFEVQMLLQCRFVNETATECRKKARIIDTKKFGARIRVAVIESNDPQIATVAKTSLGVSAQLVIVKNARNHVYMSTTRRPGLDLSEVYSQLLTEESEVQKMISKKELEETWYFQEEASRIFNGSLSAPKKPATKIDLDRIVQIVLQNFRLKVSSQSLGQDPQFKKLHKINFSKQGDRKVI